MSNLIKFWVYNAETRELIITIRAADADAAIAFANRYYGRRGDRPALPLRVNRRPLKGYLTAAATHRAINARLRAELGE